MRFLRLLSLTLVLLTKYENAFAQPVQVVPSDFGKCEQPQVSVSPRGTVDIAFGKENSVYFVRSSDGGKTFASPQLVGSLGQLALGMRRGPRMAENDRSTVIAAVDASEGNFYAWHSPDGKIWSEKIKINDATGSAREGLHGLAANGQGKCFAVWLDLRNKKAEVWGVFSSDGGKTWGKNIPIYNSPDGHVCECCHPSVIFSGENEIAVMWRNWLRGSRDMFLARSIDDGKTFGKAKKLGNGTWPLKGCPMDGGSLVSSPSGEIVTVWRRENSIISTIGDAAEKFLGNGTQPVVSAVKDKLCFVWQQNQKLVFKTMLSSEPAQVLTESAGFPSISSPVSNQPPIVVWESAQKTIFAMRVNAN